MQCASKLLCWIPVVPPWAAISLVWDGLQHMALIYVATISPLQAAFYRSFDSTAWHVANVVCELLFILSPVLHFRRGFTHDGMYINDPVFVAAHYLYGDFATDLIAAFPYAWLLGIRIFPTVEGSPPRTAGDRLLPFLRVVRLVVPLIRFSIQGNDSPGRLNPGVARVARAILLLLFTCHYIGCAWWCIGELEQDGLLSHRANETSHIDPKSVDIWGPSNWLRTTQPVANQYGHAFLWGAGMMTGYVPEDVVPHSLPEVVVTVLALFFGLIVNTAIISSTTSALQSMSFKSSKVVHKMQNIDQYMRHKRVPLALAGKIFSFYEYQLSPYRSGEGQHELSDLPSRLAMELILHTHQDLFRDCPIFRLVPPPTALALVEHFEPVVFVPGEIVIHEGKMNAALYVINRGLVKVCVCDATASIGERVLTTLTDSDFFGEQTLLKTITSKNGGKPEDCKANATCQCTSYCDMFRLTSADFMAVLEETRTRQESWTGKDVAGILSDAADERNMRAECQRRRASLWATAGQKALRNHRQPTCGGLKSAMAVSRLTCGMNSPFGSSRRLRAATSLPSKLPCSKNGPISKSPQLSRRGGDQAGLQLVMDAALAAFTRASRPSNSIDTASNSQEPSSEPPSDPDLNA
mmetsp:Transcript_13032/g.33411  ORF Transcript_13032/g.33411 Transcript_13032/m.33411 type:complete len:637 (-) Transcript_13032:266-2176(-)